VLVKFFRPLGVMAVASALCASAWGQAAQQGAAAGQQGAAGGQAAGTPGGQAAGTPGGQAAGTPGQKNWKDRAEYDLYESATKTADHAKRLEILNQWREKYPTTDFQQERLLLYVGTYQGLGQAQKIIDTSRELLKINPSDPTALYWITFLSPTLPNAATDAGIQGEAEKAANGLISTLDVTFARDKKPGTVDDATWQRQRNEAEAIAHRTLGWVAMVRKNWAEGEKHLRDSIRLNPNSGEVAFWLGTVLYAQKGDKIPQGLYYFARAAAYEGPGSLPAPNRKGVDDYLTKAYNGYHGDTSGLNELKQQARNSPTPPPDFAIKDVTTIAKEKIAREQEEAGKDPQGALWKNIKTELTSDNGPAYFESSMKGAKPNPKSFRGKVVSSTAKEIQLAMSNETTPEATLRFETPVPKVEPGTTLFFTGVAQSFTREPFMVVFDAERADVEGFPTAAPKKAKPRPGASKSRARRR
jgi:tetratricopeptide (TPR) repeat protein